MTSISRLFADQEELRTIAGEICEVCSQAEPPPQSEMSRLRWRMARTLLRHLPLKDRIVYARLRLHANPAVAGLAERYSRETDDLYTVFEAHTERWSPQAVEADWLTYRVGARQMAVTLIERIAREESELLPHLETAPETPAMRSPNDRNWAHDGWRIRELLGIDAPPKPESAVASAK